MCEDIFVLMREDIFVRTKMSSHITTESLRAENASDYRRKGRGRTRSCCFPSVLIVCARSPEPLWRGLRMFSVSSSPNPPLSHLFSLAPQKAPGSRARTSDSRFVLIRGF
jgi:hypothetical protein